MVKDFRAVCKWTEATISPFPTTNICRNGKLCRKLDSACSDSRGGGSCIGLCVPPVTPQRSSPLPQSQQQGEKPWWQNGQGSRPGQIGARPPAGPARCPANFSCPQSTVCVVEALTSARGASYKCVNETQQCGGFQNLQCQGGQLCVPDPRIQW